MNVKLQNVSKKDHCQNCLWLWEPEGKTDFFVGENNDSGFQHMETV